MTKYLLTSFLIFILQIQTFAQQNESALKTSMQFLENLSSEDFEANKKFMAKLYATDDFADKLSDSWHFQIDKLGAFQNLKSTKYDSFRDYDIVYLTCRFENSDYTIKLVFNNRHEITDIYFIPYPPLIAAGDLNSLWIIMFLILWELAWKAMGLWKAGKNQKLAWFISIFLLPTAGLLPIFYTFFIKENESHG
ncbi:MAG: DUF5652 family protein [Bacteroidales bacterium]|nr:DUF5652 family protein [Bacteroidales bacterium]